MRHLSKEVVLDTYIYVKANQNKDNSEEEIISLAKEIAHEKLDRAGLDYQIFTGEVRDIE